MTLDLLAAGHIVDADVGVVVEAYMASSNCRLVRLGNDFEIDPALAIAAHPFAHTLMAQPWASEELRRAAVRAAILLASPKRL